MTTRPGYVKTATLVRHLADMLVAGQHEQFDTAVRELRRYNRPADVEPVVQLAERLAGLLSRQKADG